MNSAPGNQPRRSGERRQPTAPPWPAPATGTASAGILGSAAVDTPAPARTGPSIIHPQPGTFPATPATLLMAPAVIATARTRDKAQEEWNRRNGRWAWG